MTPNRRSWLQTRRAGSPKTCQSRPPVSPGEASVANSGDRVGVAKPPPETSLNRYFADAELDLRMIAASLHDQGRGHVLPDMIEAVTGTRPPGDDYSPRKLPIRDPEWRKARKKAERQKYRAKRRAHMTDGEKAKQIKRLKNWEKINPEKI